MKNLITLLTLILLSAGIFCQSPEKMSYQAVIRDNTGKLVSSSDVGIRVQILQTSEFGAAVYVETHSTTTNVNGLAIIEIGGGTIVSGTITGIDWSAGPYFLKTEADPTGGTDYTIIGTSQILSVPYALHANTADSISGSINDYATNTAMNNAISRIEELEFIATGFIDPRNSDHYNVVKIGNQIWMAENLKYLPEVVGPGTGSITTPHYYVYGYDGTDLDAAKVTANYNTYGVLYNWEAAKESCPSGWHLPGDEEWTQLTDYLGGENVAGGKLKEPGTSHWTDPNAGATNETGFTAFAGGYRINNGTFDFAETYGYWWSSSEGSATSAWNRNMDYNQNSVSRNSAGGEFGFSVRCLRD